MKRLVLVSIISLIMAYTLSCTKPHKQSKHVWTFNSHNFQEQVLKSDEPVLVEFWATWCKPCLWLNPLIDEIAEDYKGRIRVGKLNIDHNRSVAARYGVRSIPTIIIYNNGKVVQRITAPQTKSQITRYLDPLIASR